MLQCETENGGAMEGQLSYSFIGLIKYSKRIDVLNYIPAEQQKEQKQALKTYTQQ